VGENQTSWKKVKNELIIFFISLICIIVGTLPFIIDSTGVLERGPRYAIFLGLMIMMGFLAALITMYMALKTVKGKKASKNLLRAVFIIFFVGISLITIQGYQTRQKYNFIDINGVERQYILHIPASYSEKEHVPLVVVLHGGSGSANQFQRTSGFDQVSDQEGFLVVYPDGLGYLPTSIHLWNSGYISAGIEYGGEDVSFIVQLITFLQEKYLINSSRIYITGHSNGGMMAYRMAGEHPEIFACVAPVSATIGGKSSPESSIYVIPTPNHSVSIIHIHGEKDLNVKYDGGYAESGFQKGKRYDKSVNESIFWWIDKNGCSNNSITQNSTNNKIILEKFSNGINQTEVILVTLKDENHFWENMNNRIADGKFYGNTLPEMVWNLMKQFSNE
jgi:polyhydroxybutyrate depolymerase